ncbi:hypothetical protein GCM10023189_39880 [Nibrella saemangeumensis]|uniref:Uncharacterized protein n=1 Tax=Nibrella saemangeumensis TaxID=1084526 RepID=A0ABP8NAW2_9BACT
MEELKFIKNLQIRTAGPLLILNAPADYLTKIRSLPHAIHTEPQDTSYGFIQAFATRLDEVERYSQVAVALLADDGGLWISYPKGTSKRYQCEFNRDSGWASLGQHNFEPVRQISIDEDWTALRFRPVDKIRTLTRRGAISPKAQARIDERNKKQES